MSGSWLSSLYSTLNSKVTVVTKVKAVATAKTAAVVGASMCAGCFVAHVAPDWTKPKQQVSVEAQPPHTRPRHHHHFAAVTSQPKPEKQCGFGVPKTEFSLLTPDVPLDVTPPHDDTPSNPPTTGAMEPASFALMGTGLIGVVKLSGRKKPV